MRIACVVVALLGLSACTDDDQRYLLTYDHPKAVSPVLSASAAPQFVRDAARVSQTEAGPAAAPTQSVAVAPEATIGAPPPAERPKQDFGAVSTAEIPPPGAVPAAPPVSPPQIAPAQPTPSPGTMPTYGSDRRMMATQPAPAPSMLKLPPPAPIQAPAPQVIVLKPPPAGAAVPSLSRAPPEIRRPLPAMVRPAPPPVDTAAAPPASSPPVQTTTGVAISTAAGTAAAAVTAPATAPQPTYSERDAAHCKAVADQRALDAVSNGYDSATEQQIFAGTYQNCMSWAAQHR
jgi:hypothetical protein